MDVNMGHGLGWEHGDGNMSRWEHSQTGRFADEWMDRVDGKMNKTWADEWRKY